MTASLIIAVDGPAASGKGTIAARLAVLYGLPFLDTGLLYRAVGVGVLDAGGSLDDGGISAVMLNYAKHIDPEKMRIDFIVHGFSEGSRENEAKALGATVYHVPYQKPRLLSNRRAIRSVIQRGGYCNWSTKRRMLATPTLCGKCWNMT